MKKYLKVGAFCLALALLAGVVYVTNLLTGYPVSYFVVKHSLSTYMEENYSDTDFAAANPRHAFKLGRFVVDVSSPSSPDSHFTLEFDADGSLLYDGYETKVASGWNTAMRLSNQYYKLCRTVMESAAFPFEVECEGSMEEAISGGKAQREEPGTYPEHWDIQQLQLDQDCEISQLSGTYGTVILTVATDEVSLDAAETSLLELRRIMEQANLPFCSVELWLQSEEQDAYDNPVETMHILNFGWDDIYEEGFAERMQSAFDATTDYYMNG